MRESFTASVAAATVRSGTAGNNCSPKSRKFAKVARALWPRKTAAELAFRAKVTERAAKYWLSGDREPSASAIAAVVAEMLS